jgi:glycosyltransferase involved in cell wall biosynthesis
VSDDERPVVSIIMPVRNERRHIEAALDAALAQDIEAPIEVVVADGMSNDGTRDVLARRADADGRVRVVDNPGGRTPSGLNAALAAARGRYVVRLDGHTIAPPDYARRLVGHLLAGECEAVGGIKRAVGTGAFGQAVAAVHGSRFGIGNARHHYGGRPGRIDHIPHGAYDVELARAIGGFSEHLVRNQDYDFDHRFAAHGGRIHFDPSISLDWHVRETPAALASQYAQYGYWKSVVLRRHPASLNARWLAPPALVATLVGSASLYRWRPARLLLVATAGAYGGVLALGGAIVGRRSGCSRPRIALALATMHLSWGAGFLAGALTPRRGR